MTAKEMLAVVLRRAVLTDRERESFTDMWDRIHRFNRCSDKQRAWIEKVYFGQKLDREEATGMKRRVVVPTWQKQEDGVQLPRPQRASPPVAALGIESPSGAGPVVVKTNARQIMERRRLRSGTFMLPTASTPQGVRVGYINYPGVQREELVTSLLALEAICPHITPGSKQYQKIAGFFEGGGVVLKVKPLDEARVA
jgi:hypothetical protein